MADMNPQAARPLVYGAIALAGIYLIKDLGFISSNQPLYLTLTGILILVAGYFIVKAIRMMQT